MLPSMTLSMPQILTGATLIPSSSRCLRDLEPVSTRTQEVLRPSATDTTSRGPALSLISQVLVVITTLSWLEDAFLNLSATSFSIRKFSLPEMERSKSLARPSTVLVDQPFSLT